MSSQPVPQPPRRSTTELLASVRENGAAITDAEVARLRDIREWALANTVTEESGEAATVYSGRTDTGLPLGGEGAPLVSEFALLEVCALLGRSTTAGRDWVGRVLELTFRLPGIWNGVQAGRVAPWRALAIADKTGHLPADAAGFVDQQLRNFAATCTWAQIDRLVDEALVRFDPAAAEAQRRDAAEQRRFDVDTGQVSFDGTVHVEGELDLADGLDLDAAIGRRAKQLGALGCEESLDVRRSMAAGELARADLALDYTTDTVPGPARRKSLDRKVELFVHLTDTVLNGEDPAGVARCGNTRTPISPEQVKTWCQAPGTTVTVRPVIDLNAHEPIDAYEIPDRLRRQVTLRDRTCRFPHCTRLAEACDLDHAVAYADGGATCPCNLVSLCRSHHRAKTHRPWRYFVLHPGCYLWTSPAGYLYLVDHHGTRDLDQPGDPPEH